MMVRLNHRIDIDLTMLFEIFIWIDRPPPVVYLFLRDKDIIPRKPGSPVLVLEKTTRGPVDVGTRYREVVQMFPFFRGEIRSVITRYEPFRYLEEDFEGAGMIGHLAYEFVPEGNGTRLIQRETLQLRPALRPLSPMIERMLRRHLHSRIIQVKGVLEGG